MRDKLKVAAHMESRILRYASDLQSEALAMVPGVDDLGVDPSIIEIYEDPARAGTPSATATISS